MQQCCPGARVTSCPTLESHVPLCWGGCCLMCQPDGIRYPLQMESAPAGRRKVQYLELLCPSKYCFLGCSCDGVSVPWWMFAGGCWAAGIYGGVLGDPAAARALLTIDCCAVLGEGHQPQPPGLLSPRSSPTA